MIVLQNTSAAQKVHATVDRLAVHRSPPCVGFLKVNSDAALARGLRIGPGIVIQDSREFVVAASSQVLSAGVAPFVAEALALLRGITLAQDCGISPCVFEADSKQEVEMVVNRLSPLSEVRWV
ncbi:hypothetical protein ACOSQ4_032944 [Xanthoceras sorbifolium]